MFGIGLPEMIVILAVALIVVGPEKLPDLARSLAKGVMELKKTLNEVKDSLSEESGVLGEVQSELQKTADELKQLEAPPSPTWQPPQQDKVYRPDQEEPRVTGEDGNKRPWETDRKTAPEPDAENRLADQEPLDQDTSRGDDFQDETPAPS